MENEKLTIYRLNELETRVSDHAKKIQSLIDELKELEELHSERYRKITNLNVRLDEGYKTQKETINRLIGSIDKLVNKVDELSDLYRTEQNRIDHKFNDMQSKIDSDNKISITSETPKDKSIGKTQLGAISVGIIGIIEVFVQYVAPLFFK
ncbi:hypothetical protein [Staphylococcus pettenkoferi]|uniref:hypothetical protein n=1 Tax=Staphylococcus pettenkoferi TaxID=170573 RepID=UPI0022759DC3|nr:hypothetical protein [Staphylococcus pettenkoferi]MCY1589840.1 hypothetical protein [Staphylococcus pettenkoferi]MCY1599230.1 hypothetical protein [Staphylococcus pettenkoferi]MCY1613796.1 hypothetical protein [Staphylococcus pettenkoferi]